MSNKTLKKIIVEAMASTLEAKGFVVMSGSNDKIRGDIKRELGINIPLTVSDAIIIQMMSEIAEERAGGIKMCREDDLPEGLKEAFDRAEELGAVHGACRVSEEVGIKLGDYVEDKVTLFEGTVVQITQILNGDTRCEVQPACKNPSVLPQTEWLEIDRLRILEKR